MRRVVRCSSVQVIDNGNFDILPGEYIIPAAEHLNNDNVNDGTINQIFAALKERTKKNIVSFSYNFTQSYDL